MMGPMVLILVRSLVTKFLGNPGLIGQTCYSGANQCRVFHVYNLVKYSSLVYEIVFQIILNALLERLKLIESCPFCNDTNRPTGILAFATFDGDG